MKRNIRTLIILTLISLLVLDSRSSSAQTELIEIDSFTRSAVRTVPFNRPFLIKAQIDAENVKRVFLIKKHKNSSFSETLQHLTSNGSVNIEEFEQNYFWTRKIGDKHYLFVSVADRYLFKPSESYFIIPDLRQTDAAAVSFFDNHYQSVTAPTAAAASVSREQAEANLRKFEMQMRRIYGNELDFGFMTYDDVYGSAAATASFSMDSNTVALTRLQQRNELSKNIFNSGIGARVEVLNLNFPSFDSLTHLQLLSDTLVNDDAVLYISGKEYSKNDLISDLNYVQQSGQIPLLITGAIPLSCILCEKADINSNSLKELSKRVANLDSSIKGLTNLQRALYLLKPKSTATSNIATSMARVNVWITALQLSRDTLSLMSKQRKKIEDMIIDSVFAGKQFSYTQILSGNTYMNFETRSRMLLTPDIGVVTPAITSAGKDLEYGIVPYIGFHINLMAVDKDIPFKSYKKHPLQHWSLMVGWSLVNVGQDSLYANFFEKSALLTGVGFRLNNVIRITGGAQWQFKLGLDPGGNPTRDLRAIPYVGMSFDLNVKQYLNGFADILSGIGKTRPSVPKTSISN